MQLVFFDEEQIRRNRLDFITLRIINKIRNLWRSLVASFYRWTVLN